VKRHALLADRLALTFIGIPFVVRTLQPVLETLDPEVEDAAASLGASRLQTLVRIVLPAPFPAWLAGFALAFARALGEYGSVVSSPAIQANRAGLVLTGKPRLFHLQSQSILEPRSDDL